MRFLSSLFGYSDDEPEDEEEFEQNNAKKNVPVLTKGLLLDVTLHNVGPLLSGRLTAFQDGRLVLERSPGQLSFNTCNIGATVYMRGYSNDSRPIDLKGIVEESSRITLRVKDIKVIPHDEHRSNFRLPLETDVQLFYQEDERMSNPESCKLVNISTGGACIQSEYIHGEGEVLRLKVQIYDYTPMVFLGEIIRVEEPSPGQFRYGFLFAQLDEQEATALTRILFNVQVGNRTVRLRKGYGAWET